MNFVVVYGRVVDDKEEGIYLNGVHFGGMALSREEANTLAQEHQSTTKSTTHIPRVYAVDKPLRLIFDEAKKQFAQLEAQMIEVEEILERK